MSSNSDQIEDWPIAQIQNSEEMEHWIMSSAGTPQVFDEGYTNDDIKRLWAWIEEGGQYELIRPRPNEEWSAVRFIVARTSASSIIITFPRARGKRGFLIIPEDRQFTYKEIFEIAKEHGAKRNSEFVDAFNILSFLNTVSYCGVHPAAELHERSIRFCKALEKPASATCDGNVIQVEFSDTPSQPQPKSRQPYETE